MSSSTETFQISPEQAAVYEAKFVPAIFAQWSPLLLEAASVQPGQRVLDVGCGTGILARTAADLVGPSGRVVGVDINEGMLSVARRVRPDLEWQQGNATALPFADDMFDTVLCQSALMFVSDAAQALREMRRVCTPNGVVGVQVYAGLDDQPANGPWVELVSRHAGAEAVRLLDTYWALGDLDVLRGHVEKAGLQIDEIRTPLGVQRWESIDEWVQIEVESTPLVDRISDTVYERIREESRDLLAQYETEDGVAAPIRAHIMIAHSARSRLRPDVGTPSRY